MKKYFTIDTIGSFVALGVLGIAWVYANYSLMVHWGLY